MFWIKFKIVRAAVNFQIFQFHESFSTVGRNEFQSFFVSLMAKPPPREILVIECYYLLCNYIVVITITVLVIEAKVLNYHSHSLIKEAARRNSSTFIYYHNSQFLVRMNLEKRKAEAEKNRSSISCRFSFPVHIYKEKKSKS